MAAKTDGMMMMTVIAMMMMMPIMMMMVMTMLVVLMMAMAMTRMIMIVMFLGFLLFHARAPIMMISVTHAGRGYVTQPEARANMLLDLQ